MRSPLVFSITMVTCLACGGPGAGGGAAGTDVKTGARASAVDALAIADAIVDDQLENAPDMVVRLRRPGSRYDRLPDESLAGIAARQAREDVWGARLAAIDRPALGATPAGLAHDIATE